MSQQPVTPRPAATLILARDGDRGVEILMVQRSPNSDFHGGAYVFPGGGLDQHDSSPEAFELCAGLTDAQASRQLKMASGGLAYWVAVVRECFGSQRGQARCFSGQPCPVAYESAWMADPS